MKQHLEQLIIKALTTLQASGKISSTLSQVQIDAAKDKKHGDYAANAAMILAKAVQKNPRELAELIVAHLPTSPYVQKVEIAGPGFINFFLSPQAFNQLIENILTEKEQYGRNTLGQHKKVLIEYVSSNPTGPLHVGHGRHAAFGSVLSNLLRATGYLVATEYYVNDAGRQMDILAASVWLRYLNLCGEKITLPVNAYQGDYVVEIAQAIKNQYGVRFQKEAVLVTADLPLDEPQGGDKEIYIDAIIERAKRLLGNDYPIVFDCALTNILKDIENDLREFGVEFDKWFSERELVETGLVDHCLATLKTHNHLYEKDGAIWFRATNFGDEKDRVMVRSNGQRTYFANDVAYHLHKFERQYDFAINIFGSDHHGYIPRMLAAMSALGIDKNRLIHLLGQFVTLYRGGAQVQMSTRGGNFVTLRELRKEVGNDAARFFYVMRKYDQHIDFDLDLAKSASNENPVYYVQYAHARICSVFKQLAEKQLAYQEANGLKHLHLLIYPQEQQLLNTLSRYPDMIKHAALNFEPHLLANYLRELAADFHTYYNSHQFLVEEVDLRDARLALISACKQVLVNGFQLMGILAPENM